MDFFTNRKQREHWFSERTIQANESRTDYPDNSISTGKYNIVNFVPKNLMLQFSKLANVYFVVNYLGLFDTPFFLFNFRLTKFSNLTTFFRWSVCFNSSKRSLLPRVSLTFLSLWSSSLLLLCWKIWLKITNDTNRIGKKITKNVESSVMDNSSLPNGKISVLVTLSKWVNVLWLIYWHIV